MYWTSRTRLEVQDLPSRTLSTQRCISKFVGGTDTGWLAEEVENLAPSIVAPRNRRSPTIRPITKLTKNCPADSGLLVQGTVVPEERGEYLQKMPVHWTASPERETNKRQLHQPAPGTNEPEAPAPNQNSNSHQQAQPSTTGEFREWPDIPPTWELERDARCHLETEPNYPSNSVLGTIARQLLGWSPSARGWLEPLCGV